jgi:hypothetical protein
MLRYSLVLSALIGATLLAGPQVLAQSSQPNLQFCIGDFALCAASTCTPTAGTIEVNTATGTAPFPAAQCTCPIFSGPAIADLNGGNMQGSCVPPSSSEVWSLYSLRSHIPQEINDFSRQRKKSEAPAFVCPADLGLGAELANCFSFACERAGRINGVEVATCLCSLGGSLDGKPVPADTAFVTQAGQCNEDICFQHPVSGPFPFDDMQGGQCIPIPEVRLESDVDPAAQRIRDLLPIGLEAVEKTLGAQNFDHVDLDD